MAWRLKGTYFENCNCNVLCPCGASSLALPADNERCLVAFAFNVTTGDVDGVDVGGLSLLLVADAPGQMTDGKWRFGVIMDAAASPAQAQALGAVFGGQRGGPMAVLAPLMGEHLGMEDGAYRILERRNAPHGQSRQSRRDGRGGFRPPGDERTHQAGRRRPPGEHHPHGRASEERAGQVLRARLLEYGQERSRGALRVVGRLGRRSSSQGLPQHGVDGTSRGPRFSGAAERSPSAA